MATSFFAIKGREYDPSRDLETALARLIEACEDAVARAKEAQAGAENEANMAAQRVGTLDAVRDATIAAEQAAVAAREAAEAARDSASGHAINASASATNAAASASTASTKASQASSSASTASTKATEASTSASAAATSASNAAASAGASSTSASQAATSATNAASSATLASTKAAEASVSATTSATKATEASTSATTAVTKATQASVSASNAAGSATEAAASASQAAASASQAAASAASALTTATNLDASVMRTNTNQLVQGSKTFASEIISTSANAFRVIANNNYGVFWRADGEKFYLLLTDPGSPYGVWNNYRPFSVDLASGSVSIGTGLSVNNKRITSVGTPVDTSDAVNKGYVDGVATSLSSRSIVAGSGLTGGGDLSDNRTITLGTPSSITETSTNSVTETSHTHAISETAIRRLIAEGVNGAIGTYVLAQNNSAQTYSPGQTVAGSTLAYSSVGGSTTGSLIGTWKCMGYAPKTTATLFLRIA